MTKRTSYDIIAEVLGALRDRQEHSVTHVQYKANMGTMQLTRCKEHLIEKGFIVERIDGRSRYIRITSLGIDWLSTFLGLREMLYGKSGTRKD